MSLQAVTTLHLTELAGRKLQLSKTPPKPRKVAVRDPEELKASVMKQMSVLTFSSPTEAKSAAFDRLDHLIRLQHKNGLPMGKQWVRNMANHVITLSDAQLKVIRSQVRCLTFTRSALLLSHALSATTHSLLLSLL